MKAKCKVLTVSVMFIFVGCSTQAPAPDTKIRTSDMRSLSQAMSSLLPLVHDPIQFSNPANREIIEREVTRLASFHHAPGDPAFAVVASRFNSDMQEAKRQFDGGNSSGARFLLRNATNYCIACHTQTNNGPQFRAERADPFYQQLGALDRAQYLIALREFDDGVREFERAMSSPDVALMPFAELESATLKALAVAVRVKKDPQMADRLITRMIESKWAPVYLQMSGLKWRASIRDWNPKAPRTLGFAKKLIQDAWKKQMESPLSRSGLIEYLRASDILHDLLKTKRKEREYAEILYYGGIASEALHDLDLIDVSERYYEGCIRAWPHSPMARNCYLRLESSQIASFISTDAGRLPVSLREKLDELKKLAESQGKGWSEP